MAKKRYRMTPRRRAAIKKAQAASARKRRRRNIKNGAKVVGLIGAGVVGTAVVSGAQHNLNKFAKHPITNSKKAVNYLSGIRSRSSANMTSAPIPTVTTPSSASSPKTSSGHLKLKSIPWVKRPAGRKV